MGNRRALTLGGKLTRYQIQSAFYGDGDSVADAKARRVALRAKVQNFKGEIVKIEFDHDSNELDGWFLIDDINTDIQGNNPNAFDFSLSATRLGGNDGGVGSFEEAIYWKNYAIDNSCGVTGDAVVPVPNSETNYDEIRVGNTGDCKVLIAPSVNPIETPLGTDYETSCQLLTRPADEFGVNDYDIEIEGVGQTTTDYAFRNGLITAYFNRFIDRQDEDIFTISLYWWSEAASNWSASLTCAAFQGIGLPQLLEKSDDRISWQFKLAPFITSGQDAVDWEWEAKFTLTRGNYFVLMELIPVKSSFTADSQFFNHGFYGTTTQHNHPSDRWDVHVIERVVYGNVIGGILMDCDGTGLSGSTDYSPFPYTVAVGQTQQVGLLAYPTALTSASSYASVESVVSPLHRQFIGNTWNQFTLVKA